MTVRATFPLSAFAIRAVSCGPAVDDGTGASGFDRATDHAVQTSAKLNLTGVAAAGNGCPAGTLGALVSDEMASPR